MTIFFFITANYFVRLWRLLQIENNLFLNKEPPFNRIAKVTGVQNQSPISFGTLLVCNKILKVRNFVIIRNGLFV